ncbi:MAG: hypothetical protein ACREPH_01340 [Rhodanobacteraceae bacterium]
MKGWLRVVAGISLAASCSGVFGETKASRVDFKNLRAQPDLYSSKKILVHGCFVDTVIEGALIQPCGNHNWRNIFILEVADGSGVNLVHIESGLHATSFAVEVEADMVGTVVRETRAVPGGKPRTIYVFQLQDVLNPRVFRNF